MPELTGSHAPSNSKETLNLRHMEKSPFPYFHPQSSSVSLVNAPQSTYADDSDVAQNLSSSPTHTGGQLAPNATQIIATDNGENASVLLNNRVEEKAQISRADSSPRQITLFKVNDSPHLGLKTMAWLIFRRTAGYTLLGFAFMILGIGLIQGVILPKIHTCPPSATCSTFWDPDRSNILNILQILMGYWLKLGLVVSSFGLLRLSAFQSWFILINHGNTINNLDLHLGAIKGSPLDAARLLLRKRNFMLSLLILALIGIDGGINLFVGLSIIRTQGSRKTLFTYQGISRLPNSKFTQLNTDGQVAAIGRVASWAVTDDTTHSNAFRGSLVVPDSRKNSSINAEPGGPIIDGTLSCSPIPIANITTNTTASVTYIIHLSIGGRVEDFLALSSTLLGVSEAGGIDTATAKYLWVSNTTDLLPNATVIGDGNFYATLCRHSLSMRNASNNDPKAQYINPNAAAVPGCNASDVNACVADSVSNAILSWWGGMGTAIWNVNCRGGVLGPLHRENESKPCPLTVEVWKETATSMLDAIIQTSPTDGSETQELIAHVETINPGMWWLQGLIPTFSALLYLVSLIYTCYLSKGNANLKELDLAEVIGASQTEHIRDLVQAGRLRKATVRYGSNQGFVSTSGKPENGNHV
jgi:hypothetical protein